MRILRLGAVMGVAACLVGAWTTVQARITPANQETGTGTGTGPVTYYIRPGGHDTAAGTSPATAWRTLARASQAQFKPGQRLLLLGGHQYAGTLSLGPGDGGSATRPVLISSYGTGRATIISPASAIVIDDTAGIAISNLVLTGSNALVASHSGIQMFSDRAKGMFSHVTISKVNISGFGFGIAIGALHDGAGFGNVTITRSSLHGNLDAGLFSYGPNYDPKAPGYANQNFYISRVRAFGNLGDPANVTSNTGSGIELGSVSHATVIDSVAYRNGGKGGATQQGPIGIWAYDSTRVLFAHDVSHDNRSSNTADGGGFGLDRDTSDSVMQYNFSYHNSSAGFLLYSPTVAPGAQTGNTVRFNISYGDAIGTNHVYGAMAANGRVNYGRFYQNTIILTKGNTQPVVKLGGILHHVQIYNNILVAAKGPVVETVQKPNHPLASVKLAGNDYFATAGPWFVQWGPTTEYLSIGAWRRGTGEELVNGRPTGRIAAPRFVGPVPGPSSGAGFLLGRRSPLRGAGLNLSRLFGISAGPVYFSGKPYNAARPDIGAQ